MEFEDVQKFIHEIRKRPMLWDSNLEDYNNQSVKKKAWIEVCKIACPNYAEKTEAERKQIAKEMHKKWKNLRDAYIRHIRVSKKRTGKRAKRVKPYVYGRQMDFLKEVVNCGAAASTSLRSSMDRRNDISTDSELMEEIVSTAVEISHAATSNASRSYGRSERRMEDASMSYIDYRQQRQVQSMHQEFHREQHQENDDMAFFRSLLPTLQMLRPEQKLTFRIDVMKLLTTYTTSRKRH